MGVLLLGTVFWGASFTWSKAAGASINQQAGLQAGALIGPILLLAVRFLLSGLLCALLVPRSRRGWTWPSILRGWWLGFWVGLGMMLQSLGLDRTSEAVSAFLTALTVLFVPLMMTFAVRKPPARIFWAGVAVATAGVWLLTGATPQGFGEGELLSLGCAVVFSIYIIYVNSVMSRDDPWRMTLATFIACGVVCLLTLLFVTGGQELLAAPRKLLEIFLHADVFIRAIVLTLVPTFIGYSLLTTFQPMVDPTRAALIYLMEPIFAAGYAYVATGATMTTTALAGAALILIANVLVEFLTHRRPMAT